MNADEGRLRIHSIDNSELAVGPRHAKPMSDDLVLAVRHISSRDGRSILLTRAKATELHEFLGKWLATGWDGVKQVEGESTSDVIEHFQDIAIRERIAADRVRVEADNRVDAALALIPADKRTADLVEVARLQSELWQRQQNEIDGLERFRRTAVQVWYEITEAKSATADQIRTALRKHLDRYNHPKPKPLPDVVPDAPIYVQTELFGDAALDEVGP